MAGAIRPRSQRVMTLPTIGLMSAPMDSQHCARCRGKLGTLTLLTSMTRYYHCRTCEHRWQVSRVDDIEAACDDYERDID